MIYFSAIRKTPPNVIDNYTLVSQFMDIILTPPIRVCPLTWLIALIKCLHCLPLIGILGTWLFYISNYSTLNQLLFQCNYLISNLILRTSTILILLTLYFTLFFSIFFLFILFLKSNYLHLLSFSKSIILHFFFISNIHPIISKFSNLISRTLNYSSFLFLALFTLLFLKLDHLLLIFFLIHYFNFFLEA